MPGDRRLSLIGWIQPDVMISTVVVEPTAIITKVVFKSPSLHDAKVAKVIDLCHCNEACHE
jgi:hypothetical protein